MIKNQEATGVILCGGKSSRMGFDKALLQINHQYVLAETVNKVAEVLPEVVLVTDTKMKFSKIAAFDQQLFLEDDYQQAGPLGGLVTAMRRIKTPYLFLIACDIPNISPRAITTLLATGTNEQVVLFQQQQRIESLFGLYHHSCLPFFEAQLATGNGQIRYHFPELQVKLISDGTLNLSNINMPSELSGWLK